MLVLSRREGENLTIGDNVVVTVLKVHGNRVRMGVDAGLGVADVRGELYRTRLEGDSLVNPPGTPTTA